MKAFYIKTSDVPALFLGNDEAIFMFMTRELAQQRLDVTEADPGEGMKIVQIQVEEIQ